MSILFIPPSVLMISAFIGWAGRIVSWTRDIYRETERRRIEAFAKGKG